MTKYLTSLGFLIVTLTMSNCISLAPSGSLYSNVVGTATIVNKDMSSKEGLGSKTGEACVSSYLGLVATGDAGIKAAAKAGGINNVRGLDVRMSNVLGSVYVTQCTIVHGD